MRTMKMKAMAMASRHSACTSRALPGGTVIGRRTDQDCAHADAYFVACACAA